MPLLLRATVARHFGWAGADRRAPSVQNGPKRGLERAQKDVSRRALHAITRPPASLRDPRALAFPLERYFLTDRMRVF
eukprot:COSAG01_NODE_8586_length_2728_cov_10.055915_1_plen_77_part_10